jgi:hypothetical protein
MSVHIGGENETTYSDFEFQRLDTEIGFDGVGNSETTTVRFEAEVIENQGGLESDEIAELVAIHRDVHVAGDDFGSATTENTLPGNTEYRGVFGADLGEDDLVNSPSAPNREGEVLDGPDVSSTSAITLTEEPGVFDFWDVVCHPGFADNANTLGGGASLQSEQRTINFREMYGRGPILDPADDLSIVGFVVNNRQEYNVEAVARVECVWDISTVEGQRKQFALP